MATKILILGGTTEARLLAGRLAGNPAVLAIISLAGRTAEIVPHPVPVRVGGFGGADGLAAWLAAEKVDVLVDATHPFAAAISANAVAAARNAGVPLLALRRPEWRAVAGDRWILVTGIDEALRRLGRAPRRVFLPLGRQEMAAFAAVPQHFYLVRSIDPVENPEIFRDAALIVDRGPFSEIADGALMKAHRIDAMVARNSGGAAGYPKIAAARALAIEVFMIGRPALPEAETVATVEEALAWLDHRFGAERGA